VVIARFDPATGQLALDERFREEDATEPGFRMDNKTWPHGGTAKGIPHGAVPCISVMPVGPRDCAGVRAAGASRADPVAASGSQKLLELRASSFCISRARVGQEPGWT
jgi:hypothetical protein